MKEKQFMNLHLVGKHLAWLILKKQKSKKNTFNTVKDKGGITNGFQNERRI